MRQAGTFGLTFTKGNTAFAYERIDPHNFLGRAQSANVIPRWRVCERSKVMIS
jgi:hypothetical protein